MEEEWRRYESLIIFDPEGGTEATEELVQRARNFVIQDSGRILKSERWGVRDLAFEVKGRRKGYYLLLDYAGLPRVATELDRRLNLIDSVLKFQTIKLEDRVDPDSLPELEEVSVLPSPHTVRIRLSAVWSTGSRPSGSATSVGLIMRKRRPRVSPHQIHAVSSTGSPARSRSRAAKSPSPNALPAPIPAAEMYTTDSGSARRRSTGIWPGS